MSGPADRDGYLPVDPEFCTKSIHVGSEPEQWNSRAVVPPISLSTTFKQSAPAQFEQFEYSRSGNPSRVVLEQCFAALEGARYGVALASGLACLSTIVNTLSQGDHIIAMDDLYGGTNRYLSKVSSKFGVDTTFVDATDMQRVSDALTPRTRLVWIETPTNPTMKLVDIAAVSAITRARDNVLLVVDNTFMSPYFQRPLDLGADAVIHSATKYINGHSDVVMGLVATSNQTLHDQLRFLQNAVGAVPSPFDCYLVSRSIKTLALRMERHSRSAMELARFLSTHPMVERVLHPGLESHPQHELAMRQTSGCSGTFSFYLRGDRSVSVGFLKALRVITLAESLGGYESLAELPSLMTHASVSAEERQRLGITDSLVRVSVGLEDVHSIIDDVKQALQSVDVS